MEKNRKVAIVHDWLYGGGAELVVEALHKLYPDAPIYTSYASEEWQKRLHNKVVTGYLQKPVFVRLRKYLPVLRQHWFKNLDLSEFDLVLSSSGNGEAKFVKKRPGAVHICYCHTPTHFYWRKYEEYLQNPGFRPRWLARIGLMLLVKPLRRRDYRAAQGVDQFIANSSHIQHDIEHFYGRESTVVWPPVDVAAFAAKNKSKERSGFVIWGRHTPYKRLDLAVRACSELGLPLTVIGTGPEVKRLKKIAGPTVEFTGWIDKKDVVTYAHRSAAFIFPTEEDFGIAPVEAMAAGLPVIAYKAGGSLDYVVPGRTGVFFEEQTVASLSGVLQNFTVEKFDSTAIAKHAETFSRANFDKNVASVIKDACSRTT